MEWAMRYTFHTGYEPPAMRPQFLATLGTADPAAHIRYAAKMGVAGILYPWAMDRPHDEIVRVRAALDETGLCCSCIVSGDSSVLFTPLWCDRSEAGRAKLADVTGKACELALSLKSEVLAAFVILDASCEDQFGQRDNATANLQDMAALAGSHGLKLGLEPMILPGLMFQSVGSALDVIRQVDRPNFGIIYDTAHVAQMEGALMPAFLESLDHLVLLQIADLPGRVEPGAGELDIIAVADEAQRNGYSGLVDLEHGWAAPTLDGERLGLERIRTFDARLRSARQFESADQASVSDTRQLG